MHITGRLGLFGSKPTFLSIGLLKDREPCSHAPLDRRWQAGDSERQNPPDAARSTILASRRWGWSWSERSPRKPHRKSNPTRSRSISRPPRQTIQRHRRFARNRTGTGRVSANKMSPVGPCSNCAEPQPIAASRDRRPANPLADVSGCFARGVVLRNSHAAARRRGEISRGPGGRQEPGDRARRREQRRASGSADAHQVVARQTWEVGNRLEASLVEMR